MFTSSHSSINNYFQWAGDVTVNATGSYRLFEVPVGKRLMPISLITITKTTYLTTTYFRFGFNPGYTQWIQSSSNALGSGGGANESKDYQIYATGISANDTVGLSFTTYGNPSGRTNIIFKTIITGYLY